MSALTRRTALAGLAAVATTTVVAATAAAADPLPALAEEWTRVMALVSASVDERKQAWEAARARDFYEAPFVVLGWYRDETGQRTPIRAISERDVREHYGRPMHRSETDAKIEAKVAELRAAEPAWEAEYERSSLRAIDDRNEKVCDEASAIERRIFETPARSLAGVLAKLRVALGLMDGRDPPAFEDRDWENAILVAGIRDLERLAAAAR